MRKGRRRARGEGTILKRKDGRWAAVIDLGSAESGRKRKWFYGATQAEVRDKLTEARNRQHSGLAVDDAKQTLAQFLDAWLNIVAKPNTKAKTYEQYAYVVNRHIAPGLGKATLARLSVQDVQGFLKTKSDAGLSARTVKHLRDTLRNALNVAVEWNLLVRNPAARAKPPSAARKQITVFDAEQARRFLEAAKGSRLEALFSVALSMALRRGEALGLHWSDFDFENRTLTIRYSLQRVAGKLLLSEPKTPQSRATIFLPQVATSALTAHRRRQEREKELAGSQWREQGYVFTTRRGTPVDPRNALRALYSVLKKANLPSIRFHDLRHSAATLLLVQGVHPRIVMELLRHGNIATTMDIYGHVIPAAQRAMADKMDEILNPLVVNLDVRKGSKGDEEERKLMEGNGRGEWIRTTDLLVPNQAL